MKQKSLISRTLMMFMACAATCFLLTAPLFYLLTKYFYAEDLIDIIEAVNQGKHIPPLDLERDIIAGMMLQFLLIFLVITLAWFVTMRFATKRLWRPFNDTLHKVELFNLTQDDVPHLNDTNIREFASLNQSFTRLMMKDKETYRIQKEFTENASHELQTPIAIIRSKTELLMQEELNEKQMQLVGDLHTLTIRMGHLNNNLLLLSKIENDQYADMEEINLGDIIMDSLPLYQSLRNDSMVHIDDQRHHPRTTIHANRTLLECMLKNLIVNALRHAERNSTINIRLTDNSLNVSNTSDDGKPLDRNKLFQRFYTDSAKHKGNGLGLAIVKAICQYHHWLVDYLFEAGCHHFIVDFNHTTNTKNI